LQPLWAAFIERTWNEPIPHRLDEQIIGSRRRACGFQFACAIAGFNSGLETARR
jgi:hypothetical protein